MCDMRIDKAVRGYTIYYPAARVQKQIRILKTPLRETRRCFLYAMKKHKTTPVGHHAGLQKNTHYFCGIRALTKGYGGGYT